MLVVVSGPSGCGKGTLLSRVLTECDDWSLSVSATTRPKRSGEIDGVHYFFKTHDEFKKLIADDGFLEYAEYCGNYYGTPKESVDKAISEGKHIILEIEVDGAMQIKRIRPDTLLIFVKPPTLDELKRRLLKRKTDSDEVIAKRLAKAEKELEMSSLYDKVIINDDLDTAVNEFINTVAAYA
jgi:guanylate kinase